MYYNLQTGNLKLNTMKKLVLTLAVAIVSSATIAQETAVKKMDAVKISK
jgi:hypothetical protein